ncbi:MULTISPECIES: tyrosine recombinase XerC [Acetobacter]|uniref:site-specific integrase n=1 Tax=Acetobacter TaxID=434 RepID=UPI00376FAB0F
MQMEDFASHQVTHFASPHIRAFVARKSKTPAASNSWLKMFGMIFQHGVDRGDIERNPATGISRMKEMAIGAKSWEDSEIEKYESYWASGTIARLALYLLLYTGQRRSDVVRMGWSDIQKDGTLSVEQMKTGTRLLIPIHPVLAREIDQIPKSQSTFLATKKGCPFSVHVFSHSITRWVKMCGIKERLSPHGLRKAAARRMAEAGCSPHQIASITGHKTLSEIERYTRAVDQSRLARDAVLKIGRGSFTKS